MIRKATVQDAEFIITVVEKLDDIISDDGVYSITKDNVILFIESPYVDIYILDEMGFFLFVQRNSATVELHTCMLKGGKSVVEAAKIIKEYIFKRYYKITTLIPTYNRAAMFMALRCGFKKEGINKKSFMKNKILFDQYHLGMCKE